MAEFNFDDLLSHLNFSDPVNGEDLLKWILNEVDPVIFSDNIKNTLISPLLTKIKDLYKQIGDSSEELRGDSKKVKKLSEPFGLTLIYEDNQYRKKIRDLFNSLVSKFDNIYKKIGDNINSSKEETLEAFSDPSGIIELRKNYKGKLKDILENNISNIKTENIPQITNKIDSSPDSFTKNDKNVVSNPLEIRFSKEGLNDLLSNVFTLKIKTKGYEQESLEPDKPNNFSEENLTNSIVNALNKMGLSKISDKIDKSNTALVEHIKDIKDHSGMLNILGLLGAGSLLIGTAGLLWDSHIKPWIEKKFNFDFKGFDKFDILIEQLSKWFVVGGSAAGGLALKAGGMIFKTAGEIGEKMIGSVFKAILGEGAEKGLTSATIKLFSGATIKKIFGNVLGGVGKAALKGIPLIGTLISLGFAIDNMIKGNYIQGTLDIVNGLVGLIPGAGLPLSLGVSALQVFLEAKTSDIKEGKNMAQLSIIGSSLGSAMTGIWTLLKKLPFFEAFANLGDGIYKIFTGDIRDGFSRLSKIPFIGASLAPIVSIMDNIEYDQNNSISGFNIKGFYTDVKKRMLRSFLSMVPDVFNMRYTIAKMMGIEGEYQQEEWSLNNTEISKRNKTIIEQSKNKEYSDDEVKQYSNQIQSLIKDIEKTKKNITENKEKGFELFDFLGWAKSIKNESLEQRLGFLQAELEKNQSILENQKNRKTNKIVQVQDMYLPSKTIHDPKSNTTYSLAPDDNVLAYKSDGIFDKTLTDIKNIMISLTKILTDIEKNIQNNNAAINNINVNNTSTKGDNSFIMSGKRDPIYDLRTDYWKKFPNERVFA